MGANFSHERQAVILAQPQVQNDRARLRRSEVAAQFASAGHGPDRQTVFLEIVGDHLPDGSVIIHNKEVTRFTALIAHPPDLRIQDTIG